MDNKKYYINNLPNNVGTLPIDMEPTKYSYGMSVWDDLTRTHACITEVNTDEYGNIGIRIDNTYLDGWRHPWEITLI